MKKINRIFTLLFCIPLLSAFLISCSVLPTHVVVAPELLSLNNANYQNKQATFTVNDLRVAKHVIQILRKDEAAQLMTSQDTLTNIIEQSLLPHYKKQGLMINNAASNHIEVLIDKALINVDQTLMSYKVTNIIALRVKINNGEKTLTKNFNVKGSSNGPLKADIAVLERDFNQQLASLLTQILNHHELSSFMK